MIGITVLTSAFQVSVSVPKMRAIENQVLLSQSDCYPPLKTNLNDMEIEPECTKEKLQTFYPPEKLGFKKNLSVVIHILLMKCIQNRNVPPAAGHNAKNVWIII